MTTNTEQLKPCPFCGGVDIRVHMYGSVLLGGEPDGFAQCHDCSTTGPTGASQELVVAAWNRRAPTGEHHDN